MRLIFLIRSLNYGGAERQLVTLARGLHQHGCSVKVAVFYPNGPLKKDLDEEEIPVISLAKRGRWDVLGFLLRLVRLLRAEKPDILHSYMGTPNIFSVLLKPIVPSIRMVWGVRASNKDLDRYDWLVRLSYRLECRLSRFADLIIVNSHAGLDYAVAHSFPKNKMVVISNGIDTERFCPNPEARQGVRREWGITEDEKLIGLVGRLDPIKDHPTFLKAAALLAQEREDVRFVCVGDGPADYRQELYALGRELGLTERLIWAGTHGDMPAVYNALDIIISSSKGEGFPNVIGEAMACGVPCVATDVGDSALIIEDMGIIVQPKDPQTLVNGIKDILRGSVKLNSNILRKRIVDNFSIQSLIDTTERVLARGKN